MAGPNIYVEIEFTPGAWTDITGKVELGAGLSTKFGRQTPYSSPQPSSLTLTLNNSDGRFTAGRQGIYWPNVRPGVRVRYGWIIGATRYPRFFGYVAGWPTTYDDQGRARATITAFDRLKRIAKLRPLPGALVTELRADAAMNYWPLTTEYSRFDDFLTGAQIGGSALSRTGEASSPLTMGDSTGADPDQPTSVLFAPATTTSGEYLTRADLPTPTTTGLTVEATFKTTATGAVRVMVTLVGWATTIAINAAGQMVGQPAGLASITSAASFNDGQWHHVALTFPTGSTGTARLYVDGVQVGTQSVASSIVGPDTSDFNVGANARWFGNLGHVALTGTQVAAARIAAHASAARGWPGETVDQRVSRLLSLMGVPVAEQSLETSDVVLTPSPQKDVSPATALEAMTNTEGGGSILYVEPDGLFHFTNRDHRKSGGPDATLDAVADINGDVWSPDLSEDQVENQVTFSDSTGYSTTIADEVSIAMFGVCEGSAFTTYDAAPLTFASPVVGLRNAQQRLAAGAYPKLRLEQVEVDLWTSENAATLYPLLAAVRSGDRLRVANMPDTAGAARQLDVIVEGWADRLTDSSCSVAFDTSPADNPAELVFDDNDYGRWQANGQTLTAAITGAATALQITSPAGGAVMTTDASMYPFTIVVGAEHIELNAPPSGAVSPQSFTGVTRGVDGTTAAAQSAASSIDLFPTSTWTL